MPPEILLVRLHNNTSNKTKGGTLMLKPASLSSQLLSEIFYDVNTDWSPNEAFGAKPKDSSRRHGSTPCSSVIWREQILSRRSSTASDCSCNRKLVHLGIKKVPEGPPSPIWRTCSGWISFPIVFYGPGSMNRMKLRPLWPRWNSWNSPSRKLDSRFNFRGSGKEGKLSSNLSRTAPQSHGNSGCYFRFRFILHGSNILLFKFRNLCTRTDPVSNSWTL